MLKLQNMDPCFTNQLFQKERNYMKKFHLFMVGLLLTTGLFLSNILAQNFTESSLPSGAIAGFGKGWIHDMEFSPPSDQLAVATTIGVWIYDARTGKERPPFSGIMGGANAVSYSPDGLVIAAAHSDWTVRLWDVSTGKPTSPSTLRGHTAEIHAVEYSPDGKRIASGSADKTIRIWDPHADPDSESLIAILPYRDSVRSIAFSPDSRMLAGGSDDGIIQVWNADTGDRIYEFNDHTDSVQAVHFSRNRTELVSASLDRTAILWSLVGEGGKLHPPIQHKVPVYAAKFSPDGSTFATSGADKLIRLWDTSTAKHNTTFTGHKDSVPDFDFSSDDSTLASGSPDGTILLWDRIGKRVNIEIPGHTGGIKALAYTADKRIRACGTGLDGKLRLWDAGTSSELSILREHTGLTKAVTFSKDGKTIASGGSEGGTIFLSDVLKALEDSEDIGNDSLLNVLTGNTHGITALALSPADTTLASGGTDGRIYLLDIATRRELKILKGAQSTITALTFVVDGTHLFSGEENGTVRQWNALTGEEVEAIYSIPLGGITALSYSSPNELLAIGDASGTIQFFDLVKKRKKEKEFHMPHSGITTLVFSKDGNTLVSGSKNGTILLWNMNEVRLSAEVQDNTSGKDDVVEQTIIPQEHDTAEQTAQQIARNALNSTVYLAIQKVGGRISEGSGFFVYPGYVATNHHVAESATKAYIKLVGKDTTYIAESIAAIDEEHDLALLKVTGISTPVLPLANSDTVQIGETIYAIGNPRGFLEGTVSDGIISSIREEGNKKWLQMTAPISPGSSGGPVLNTRGEVIGISVGDIDGQNLNFAIPSNYLKALLRTIE